MKAEVARKPFATEAALCAAFLGAIDRKAWTPYAETAGWDILLARNADGFQIGVQAKLRFNAEVLSQALEERGAYAATRPAPDCRAVLVPSGEARGLHRIAGYIGITILQVNGPPPRGVMWPAFSPYLPDEARSYTGDDWYEWAPAQRHRLPEYVPDVEAGASAPLQLTQWKIAAIKIAVTLESRGYVTRADFKAAGIDHRRWIARETQWLRRGALGWERGPNLPDFRAQHPRVFAEIAGKRAEWMPSPFPGELELARSLL